MPIINSTQLDAFATVPHCLDNQFLPRDVLTKVASGELSIEKGIREREAAVRREYIRSLIYSPEVVVNRAFAVNEPAVFSDVQRYPSSVATLIDNNRLTILLLRDEPDLAAVMESPQLATNAQGRRAWLNYLATHGDTQLRYLKLTADENEAITGRFPDFIRNLLRLELPDSRVMELFKPVAADGYTPERLDAFKGFLLEQANSWLRPGETITRTTFYRQFIMPEGADISKPNIDRGKRYAFELKLLADLAYDHNLPTTLRRQSFVPTQMPSPLCLPPSLFSRGPAFSRGATATAEDVTDRALKDKGWYYESQEAFLVPDWAQLTAEDVCLIQSWPEWVVFRIAQRAVADVATPAEFDVRLRDYFEGLQAFQARLAREIEDVSSGLERTKAGLRLLKLVVRPVITWAGQLLLPALASQILTDMASEGVEFAIDISIDFLDQRHDRRHAVAVESFISRTDGVRQNMYANIRETASQRQELERMAGESPPTAGRDVTPALRA